MEGSYKSISLGYIKKELKIQLPPTTDHASKNPFSREKKKSASPIVRCGSLYKSGLKNKTWDIVRVEKPSNPSPDIDVDANITEESVEEDEKVISKAVIKFEVDQDEVTSQFKLFAGLKKIDKEEVNQRLVKLRGSSVPGKKTLVLDLDGTLLKAFPTPPEGSYQRIKIPSGSRPSYSVCVKIRPYLEYFLQELSELYEIIVFTSGEKEYAHALTYELLDKKKEIFADVLHRDHCIPNNGCMVKDLRVISNRDLKNIILVDDSLVSFCMQLSNGILISSYSGNDKDVQLRLLAKFLKEMAKCDNAREYLRSTFSFRVLYDASVSASA